MGGLFLVMSVVSTVLLAYNLGRGRRQLRLGSGQIPARRSRGHLPAGTCTACNRTVTDTGLGFEHAVWSPRDAHVPAVSVTCCKRHGRR